MARQWFQQIAHKNAVPFQDTLFIDLFKSVSPHFFLDNVIFKHALDSVDCKPLWWRGYDITGDDIFDVESQLLMGGLSWNDGSVE